MKLTKVEEQGLRLAITLARQGGQITLPEFAVREKLSEALVAKILARLRRGGAVRAARGRNGGYELARKPEELSVAMLLHALGSPVLQGCFNSRGKHCPHDGNCGLRPIWTRLEDQLKYVLERLTLADLIQPADDVARQVDELFPPQKSTSAKLRTVRREVATAKPKARVLSQ